MDKDSLFASIGKFLFQLLINKEKESSEKPAKKALAPTELTVETHFDSGTPVVAPTIGTDPDAHNPSVDWTDPKCQVTAHFTVSDCLMLHSWSRLANETQDQVTDGLRAKLITLCQKMEEIRTILNCPINVHCGYRSADYNAQVVKAIPNDVHQQGLAMDFDCNGYHTINEVHSILEPQLEALGIRMERNTPTWVHVDLHAVGNARYFNA